jgi:hypothetical protein
VKYLILIYSNPSSRKIWESMPEEDRVAGWRAYARLNDDLAASGELIVSEALADVSLARRVPATEAVSSDGPFAEVKEHLAGFYLVQCEGLERAMELAARIPEAAYGLVEVRPVMGMGGPEA